METDFSSQADWNLSSHYLAMVGRLIALGSEAYISKNLVMCFEAYQEIYVLTSELFPDPEMNKIIMEQINQLRGLFYNVQMQNENILVNKLSEADPILFEFRRNILNQLGKNGMLMRLIKVKGLSKLRESIGLP